MSNINIYLKSAAETLNSRSTRGIVMLVLNDSVEGVKSYNRKRAVTDEYSEENKSKRIDKCFDKYGVSTLKVVCYTPPETISVALKKIDGVKFNYLACPTITEDEDKKAIVDFIKGQITAKNYTVKANLANYKADYENIVSNYISSITIDGETLTGEEFTVDHACMCAVCSIGEGLTNKVLSGVTKVTLVDDTKDAESISELGQVGVVYDNDFESYVLTDDVNTKTTIDDSKEKDILKDRRVSEILSMMQDDLKVAFKTSWQDKKGNSYSNRKLLRDTINKSYFKPLGTKGALNGDMSNTCYLNIDAIREYIESLGVDTTDMKDEDILSYDTKRKVFMKARVYVLQTMGELEFEINY
ncbi:phage tail sheath subtilisin-like domain-containing protein [Clostridium sp. YIM B02569]|uniref:phage tail sheath subtilisin-like domain-containing protein n=1 Tax=Clostridium sp. YIM B02569 TaxID=2911967 RepID=UPI001EEDAE49|nr:phage tail sheath subtilisin-like domain-containing protein [Clostridium sp. YIM B02569]